MPAIQSLSPQTTIDIKNSQPQIQVLNPEDGSLVGTVVSNSVSEVDAIIEAAVIGAQKAKKLSANLRMSVLNEVAADLSNQKELF